jgi:hypothetical protein
MGGLAARCGAGVEHTGTGRQPAAGLALAQAEQQRRGPLCRQVLHRHIALAKAWQQRHRTGLGQLHRLRPHHHRLAPLLGQTRHIRLRRAPLGVDTQGHGRALVVGAQHVLPLFGPVGLQLVDPPLRVVERRHRVVVQGQRQGVALAQKAPQHRVDKGRAGLAAPARGLHGLVDQGVFVVGRRPFGPEQRQGADEQGIDRGSGGLGHQALAQGQGRAQPAQHLEAQRLRAGPRRGRAIGQRIGERMAVAHGLHRVSGVAQQARQGQGLRRGGGSGGSGGGRIHARSLRARARGHAQMSPLR